MEQRAYSWAAKCANDRPNADGRRRRTGGTQSQSARLIRPVTNGGAAWPCLSDLLNCAEVGNDTRKSPWRHEELEGFEGSGHGCRGDLV